MASQSWARDPVCGPHSDLYLLLQLSPSEEEPRCSGSACWGHWAPQSKSLQPEASVPFSTRLVPTHSQHLHGQLRSPRSTIMSTLSGPLRPPGDVTHPSSPRNPPPSPSRALRGHLPLAWSPAPLLIPHPLPEWPDSSFGFRDHTYADDHDPKP